MTYSNLAATNGNSPKKSSREGAVIDTINWHHMASTDGWGTTQVMLSSGGRTVSANYTIMNDGTIHGVVPEEERAWTSGSATDGGKGAAWDRRSITIEIENETAAPDWRISDAAINAAGRLQADLKSRHRITTVLGHKDLYERYGASYPTYCPGPDTVNRINAAEPTSGSGGTQEDELTPEQDKMLTAVFEAMCKDGTPAKNWSVDHKVDWTIRQFMDPVVKAPGGDQDKWTIYHVLDWQNRIIQEMNDRLKKIESK